MTYWQPSWNYDVNPTPSITIDAHLLEGTCPISSRSNLKRWSFRLFEEVTPTRTTTTSATTTTTRNGWVATWDQFLIQYLTYEYTDSSSCVTNWQSSAHCRLSCSYLPMLNKNERKSSCARAFTPAFGLRFWAHSLTYEHLKVSKQWRKWMIPKSQKRYISSRLVWSWLETITFPSSFKRVRYGHAAAGWSTWQTVQTVGPMGFLSSGVTTVFFWDSVLMHSPWLNITAVTHQRADYS